MAAENRNPLEALGPLYVIGAMFFGKIQEITEDAKRRNAGQSDGTAEGSGLRDDVGSQGHR
jgi:hypothetical protein